MVETTPLFWSRRVRPEKIRRLYESDARGMLDEVLLEEVGFGLYSRCADILEVSQAVRGQVKCRQCGTILVRQARGQPAVKQEVLTCTQCSWQILWEDYLRSYKGQRLFAGLADAVFESFLEGWVKARSQGDKMIAIDNLIHAFHLYQNAPGRPVGVNVIHGKARGVIDLINSLAYGPGSTPGLQASRDEWRSQFNSNLCYPAVEFLDIDQARIPEFGEKTPGIEYTPRQGAHAVILDAHRRVGVVRVSERLFLPGGGSHPGEFPEETLRREVREECGREIHIPHQIGEAVSYLFAQSERKHYQVHGHYFSAAFEKKIAEPVESDHILIWLDVQEAIKLLPPAHAWAIRKTTGNPSQHTGCQCYQGTGT